MGKRGNRETEIIKHKHIILCEGEDDKWFINWYLNSEQLKYQPAFSRDFQTFQMQGVTNLSDAMQLLKRTEGFDMVKSILAIRDADEDFESACDNVRAAFRKADFPVPSGPHVWTNGPIKTAFLLFPSCDGTPMTGALEDLCMQILAEENVSPLLGEIEKFIFRLCSDQNRKLSHTRKSKLHTYFSVTDKFISLKVGEAAKAGAFNWNSDRIRPLTEFLEELITAELSDEESENN